MSKTEMRDLFAYSAVLWEFWSVFINNNFCLYSNFDEMNKGYIFFERRSRDEQGTMAFMDTTARH